jgi:hypothetical protein
MKIEKIRADKLEWNRKTFSSLIYGSTHYFSKISVRNINIESPESEILAFDCSGFDHCLCICAVEDSRSKVTKKLVNHYTRVVARRG